MGALADWQIRKEVKIVPFEENLRRPGVLSYGLSSYGYDVRVGRTFKLFTNVYGALVDPKNFAPNSFVDIEADHCVIPPNSFALAETVEYLEIPRDIICVCLGKCVSGDTRVVDSETGDYLPIRDFIARKGARTVALDGLRLKSADVSDHRHSGLEPVYRLRTWTGQEIKATASHPFRTLDGWKPLGELRPGDRLAVARSCPVFGKEEMPEHEATLLGLLTADGQCHTPGSSPRYTTGDPVLAGLFARCAAAFGMEASPVGYLGYNLVNKRGRGGADPQPNRANLWLRRHEADKLSIDKKIPRAVFRGTKRVAAAFLRALYSGDGSSNRTVSAKGTVGLTLDYYSSSEELARGVRHLLLRFGIFSLIRDRESASGRTAWRVQVSDRDMLRLFAEEIGFVPGCAKDATFHESLSALSPEPRTRSNFDTLPREAWPVVQGAARQAGVSLNSLGTRAFLGQSVPLEIARAVADATDDPTLRGLAHSDVVWDRVESIEPAGVEAVYDLTVPQGSSFSANDILVHNSTYARCGIIVNVTPLEPEWRGKITIEISNTTPLPAKIYANEGIAQILFFRADAAPCETSYADKKGKYQDQPGLVPPMMLGQKPPG